MIFYPCLKPDRDHNVKALCIDRLAVDHTQAGSVFALLIDVLISFSCQQESSCC